MITATIAGKEVGFEWTQKTAKQIRIRLSKIGKTLQDLIPGFSNPKKAEYCVSAFLWACLPDSEFSKYESPESLAMAIDDETEAVGAWSVVTAMFDEMFPDAKKKKHFEEIAWARIELGLSESEWEQSHPQQCEAYQKAWIEKINREATQTALIRLTVAQAAGAKIGNRAVTIDDFLPPSVKKTRKRPSPEEQEHRLMQKLQMMAAIQSRKKPNG